MSLPLTNACDTTLDKNPGTLPNVSGAMLNYFQLLTFTRVHKDVVGFQNSEEPVSYDFRGVRMPFTSKQLMMKPDGERAWAWEKIFATPDLLLETDDVIQFSGTRFRIMQKWDFKEYGYVEYDMVQDYRP